VGQVLVAISFSVRHHCCERVRKRRTGSVQAAHDPRCLKGVGIHAGSKHVVPKAVSGIRSNRSATRHWRLNIRE
jgi:hypothetical protein